MRRLGLLITLAVLVSSIAFAVTHVNAPSIASLTCQRSASIVVVNLNNEKHRHILDHVWDAWTAGQPKILHIDREDADKHRAQSLKGIPTKKGYDRDEYPPAASREGGKGADVRYVISAENRSAGSVMEHKLESYCDGQRFRFERRNGS